MGEPAEVFPGNLSSGAVDRNAVLECGTPDVRFEKAIASGCQATTDFFTGLHGSTSGGEQTLAYAKTWARTYRPAPPQRGSPRSQHYRRRYLSLVASRRAGERPLPTEIGRCSLMVSVRVNDILPYPASRAIRKGAADLGKR